MIGLTDLTIRPLVAGEENLFDSIPDPLPELRQISYARGVAGGGYRPEHAWVALRGGRVVARAAWLLPPGAVGQPWLERFDLAAEPEVGAALLRTAHEALGGPKIYYASIPAGWRQRPDVLAVIEAPMAAARLAGLAEGKERIRFKWAGTPVPRSSGRFSFRPARDAAEINAVVARISELSGPGVLTGAEAARQVRGVDLATDPLGWLTCPVTDWRVALAAGEPVGLAAPAGDACYPMIAWLDTIDDTADAAARPELIADAVATLVVGGALEVVADSDADRPEIIAALEQCGFTAVRSRVLFEPLEK